jgi:hypothetical protein
MIFRNKLIFYGEELLATRQTLKLAVRLSATAYSIHSQLPSISGGDKIDDLATNSKNKNIRDLYRGINYFKRGYQPRSNFFFGRVGLNPH